MPRNPSWSKDWSLRCPRDGQDLVKRVADGVTVDRCDACGGLWFDASELDVVIGSRVVEKEATRIVPTGPRSPFGCPRCAGDCFVTSFGGVETDACSSCRGVWLDAGELARVKQAADAMPQATGLRALLKRL